MKDVTERLLIDRDKADELEVVLGSSGDSSIPEPGIVHYYDGRLIVQYSKRHEIKAILAQEAFADSMLRRIEKTVAESLSENGVEVRQRYLHSYYVVDSYFRHDGHFQILPPPPDSPQPYFLHAEHSFLLEFGIAKSPDGLVSNHRAQIRFNELSLILNALARHISLPIGSSNHEWVVMQDPKWTSQYLPLGYCGGTEHRPKATSGFTVVDDIKEMETVEPQSYYGEFGVVSGSPFQVPDTFVQSLAAYEKLDEDDKAKFLRASYWSQVSYRVFTISQSASFAALVSAVEVFLPNPEKCRECGRPVSDETCGSCAQPVAGPTKMFREFVDKYAPGIPIRDRSKLYSRRSSLSHGASLLPGDMSEMGFRIAPQQDEVWRERNLLSLIVQLVLVNWLNSR